MTAAQTKLLHVDSSLNGDRSVSRGLSAEIVARLTAGAGVETRYRDLADDPLPHYRPRPDDAAGAAHDEAILAEYLDADTVVIGAPIYNFGMPSALKAWIDRIVVAGRTFRYDAAGSPVGLAPDKRIILAVTRGGVYSEGSPFAAWEHGERHLRTVFGFLGVRQCDVVLAEGLAIGPEHRAEALAAAHEAIAALAA